MIAEAPANKQLFDSEECHDCEEVAHFHNCIKDQLSAVSVKLLVRVPSSHSDSSGTHNCDENGASFLGVTADKAAPRSVHRHRASFLVVNVYPVER